MPPKPKAKTFNRASSDVHAVDQSGNVFKGFYVWTDLAPAVKADPDLMFAKCLVLPGSTQEALKCRQFEPADQEESEFAVPQDHAFNLNANADPMSLNDIGMLPHTNEACVLDFLRARLTQGQIYSMADPLLVAMNPFKNLGNATDKIICQYRDAVDVTKMSPHVFTVSRVALENLHAVHKSQTIIVSGESGAGKTEATKQIMRYFAAAKSGTIDTRIQTAVLAANPVLEAFGNAKTVRNNNSSRFGRFMQLQVLAAGGIEYGSVRNFLLEKSRILVQDDSERSYHIFYQLIKGASREQKAMFKIKGLTEYKSLNPRSPDAPGIDDLEEWADVQKSLDSMLLSNDEKNAIYSIVSGVMLLGNVKVKSVSKAGLADAGEIDDSTREVFNSACGLLWLEPSKIEEGLTVKYTTAGGNVVKGFWNAVDCEMLKASLAKAMYDSLFHWIVRRLNQNIEPPAGFKHFMGMLDIFGFEVFKNNSLEQLFINITNEMLQKNFIDVVFERETRLYREEGISNANLEWTTNAEVIQALTAKKGSLMSSLEDQCLAPGGTDEKFLSSTYAAMKDSGKVIPAKVSSNINFLVVHTIGPIQYNVQSFLFKNKDVLRADLIEVVQTSPSPVVSALYAGVVIERGKLAKGQLIGSQFLTQLTALMELINSTEPHFVRCVKPNEEKAPLKFTSSKVLIQLHSLSILEALQLRNLGFSYRRPFTEFLFQYRFVDLGLAENKSIEPRVGTEKMLKQAKINADYWRMGKTMVFMKPQGVKDMQKRQRECLAAWDPIVCVMEAMMMRKKAQMKYNSNKKSIIRVQARCRKIITDQVPAPAPTSKVALWC